MSLVADYGEDEDSKASLAEQHCDTEDSSKSSKNKKKQVIKVQSLLSSARALLKQQQQQKMKRDVSIKPPGEDPLVVSTINPSSARFSFTEIERQMLAEFSKEDAEILAEEKLNSFLSEITTVQKSAEEPVVKNKQREEMLRNLLVPFPDDDDEPKQRQVLKKPGPSAKPPADYNKGFALRQEDENKRMSVRQRESLKVKRGQATFTAKTNRDCPDIYVSPRSITVGSTLEPPKNSTEHNANNANGDRKRSRMDFLQEFAEELNPSAGIQPSNTMKERTHQKYRKGQSEWRNESARGYWKSDEEMHLRQFYDS